MKEYAEGFYKTKTWQKCRAAYAKSVGNLCEECLSKGRYVPGEIVHHKIHLNADNITDPNVALNWDNLKLVCRECHAAEHGAKQKRYTIDEYGNVHVL